MNWLATLLKSATSRGPGLHPETWAAVEARSSLEVPEDVRELYQFSDGARFSGEVRLWSWKEVEEHTAKGLGSLQASEVWLLGTKRETGFFFTGHPRPVLRALPASARTNWLRSIPPQEFVYGLWRAADDVFVVRSLQELLQMSIPRPGDDFGEVTYVRAMAAVKNVLDALEPPPPRPSGPKGTKRSEVKTAPNRPAASAPRPSAPSSRTEAKTVPGKPGARPSSPRPKAARKKG
jgi:hypothetical protein